jgi:hypothetical protein
MRLLLEGSELIHQHKEHVQDPYSFRCIPQVHGASWDVLEHVNDLSATLNNLVRLLKPSSPFVVFSPYNQPLLDCMEVLMKVRA